MRHEPEKMHGPGTVWRERGTSDSLLRLAQKNEAWKDAPEKAAWPRERETGRKENGSFPKTKRRSVLSTGKKRAKTNGGTKPQGRFKDLDTFGLSRETIKTNFGG